MKKNMYYILTILITLFLSVNHHISGQGISINTDGSEPDPSSIMDVKSNTKGILIPRLTTSQREAITDPAIGLLVYDTDLKSFIFYEGGQGNRGINGGGWVCMLNGNILPSGIEDADGDTKIQVEESEDEDVIRFDLEGTEHMVLSENANGDAMLGLISTHYNMFVGYNAGLENNGGFGNTFVGFETGKSNTEGERNTFLGSWAGENNTTGDQNVFLGYSAGGSNTTGAQNVFLGYQAGSNNVSGLHNTFLGNSVGHSATGSGNIFIGRETGYEATGGDNVFIGNGAGYSTTGSGNTFIGHRAGIDNTTASNNTFLGYYAGANNTVGEYNIFLGYNSGFGNTSGIANTFVGFETGESNTTGFSNTFLGSWAGENNVAGAKNTFLGYSAGNSNTTGAQNVYLGHFSGANNTTGVCNTFLGNAAGYNAIGGNENVFIGHDAGYWTTGSGNIFIGSHAGYNETGSNKLYINNGSGIPLIYGDFSSNQIGIKTNSIPSDYSFAVDGKVICEEITVQLFQSWPDYVFEKDYELITLEDLEKSIRVHKHLPGIPTAKEIKEEGISVGIMQAKMMEKIEELTLYIIQQQKEINTLKKNFSNIINNL